MNLFGKKNKKEVRSYDPARYKPVLHCSICTGEQVAGFRDTETGRFEDIMLIRDDRDLQEFMQTYGVESLIKEY